MGGRVPKAAAVLPYTRVAARSPAVVELQSGERCAWCSCGYSSNQPYCDGSHTAINIQNEGLSGFEPFAPEILQAKDGEEVSFEACQCKQTGTPPFCDGSHNDLTQGPEIIHATDFLPFEVTSTSQCTHDTVVLQLSVHPSALSTLQLLSTTIGSNNSYHFSVEVTGSDGSLQHRPYTPIEFDPEAGLLQLVVKRYSNGRVSPQIHQMRPGDVMRLRGPLPGSFEGHSFQRSGGQFVLFAAGTGITPVLQMAQTVVSDSDPSAPKVRLYYANKSEADILCVPQLSELSSASESRFQMWNILEEGPTKADAFQGFTSRHVLEETGLVVSKNDLAVVCGPPLYNRFIYELLLDVGFEADQITIC